MPASRPFAIDFLSGLVRIGGDETAGGPRAHPSVRALGPALETVFGLEHAALFPDTIQALAEALMDGPLGSRRPTSTEPSLETA